MYRILVILCALVCTPLLSWAQPKHIVVLRHAEKPFNDQNRRLSPTGYARASLLATAISEGRYKESFDIPVYMYATSSKGGRSKRAKETLKPLRDKLGFDYDHSYRRGQESMLIRDILDEAAFDQQTILISWVHDGIPRLFQAMGAVGAPRKWPKTTYDVFWVGHLQPDGTYAFEKVPQQLLPRDRKTCQNALTRAQN